jgi:hypothetical protein
VAKLELHAPVRKKKLLRPFTPTENAEQKAVISWARGDAKSFGANAKWPELNWLYMVPNGAMLGGRNRFATFNHLRSMGLNVGCPDLILPAARDGFFGYYLEGKTLDGGRLSDDQERWRVYLAGAGYKWDQWNGAAQCIQLLIAYLKQPRTAAIPFVPHDQEIGVAITKGGK